MRKSEVKYEKGQVANFDTKNVVLKEKICFIKNELVHLLVFL